MKRLIGIILIIVLLIPNLAFAEEDVPSSWAEDAVNELKGLNQFRSEAFKNYKSDITRGEFIYFAVRMYEVLTGEEIQVDESIMFTDTTDIFAIKGATVGITKGIGNNQFGYDNLLTREQLATLMINVTSLLEIEMTIASNETFDDDNEISSWAKDSIYKARSNNIISGVGNNMVNAQGTATVQIAIIITNRILQEKNGFNAKKGNGENVKIDIKRLVLKITSTPVDGEGSDVVGGYVSDEMDVKQVGILSSWTNNPYKRVENSTYDQDLEKLDKMFESALLDISPTGAMQIQTTSETGTDGTSKAVVTRTNGQPTIRIKDWATTEAQRGSYKYVYTMNMVREVIKFYAKSNADAELIYAYIDNAVMTKTDIASQSGITKTFGKTTVTFVDPGYFGVNIVFE